MQYVTHNDRVHIDVSLSHKQGNLDAGYDLLCKLFGHPTMGDGQKVDAEWRIEFEDGTKATIHNWKNGYAYCGVQGTPTTQITRWSVGGYNQRSLDLVKRLVDDHETVTTIQGHIEEITEEERIANGN